MSDLAQFDRYLERLERQARRDRRRGQSALPTTIEETQTPAQAPEPRLGAGRSASTQSAVGRLFETERRLGIEEPTPRYEDLGRLQAEGAATRAADRASREYSPLPDELGWIVPPVAAAADLVAAPIDAGLARLGDTSAATRRDARDVRWERGAEQAGRDILADNDAGGQVIDFITGLPEQMRQADEEMLRTGSGAPQRSVVLRTGEVLGDLWTGFPEAGRDARARAAYSDEIADYEARDRTMRLGRGEQAYPWAERVERNRADRAHGDDFWTTGTALAEFAPGVGFIDDIARFGARQGLRATGREIPEVLARAPTPEPAGPLTQEGRQFRNEAAASGALGVGTASLADRALEDEGIDEQTSLDEYAAPAIGAALGLATARQLPRAGELADNLSSLRRLGAPAPEVARRLPEDAPMTFEGAPRGGETVEAEFDTLPPLRTDAAQREFVDRAVVYQGRDDVTPDTDIWAFRGPDGAQIAVSMRAEGPEPNAWAEVRFEDLTSAGRGAPNAEMDDAVFARQNRFSAANVDAMVDRVVATVRADAQQFGRGGYELSGADPVLARKYRQIAGRMQRGEIEPIPGYSAPEIRPDGRIVIQRLDDAPAPQPVQAARLGDEELPDALQRMPLLEAGGAVTLGGIGGAALLNGEAEASDGSESGDDWMLPALGVGSLAAAGLVASRGRGRNARRLGAASDDIAPLADESALPDAGRVQGGNVTRVYHGTSAPEDFATPSLERSAIPRAGSWVSEDPAVASKYASGNNARVLPLDLNGRIASADDLAQAWRDRTAEKTMEQLLRDRGFAAYRNGTDEIVVVDDSALSNAIGSSRSVPDGGSGRPEAVRDLRERIDPFGATNPWDDGQKPITIADVRRAMARGQSESRNYTETDVEGWARQDHINRIATLAREGWSDPIDVTTSGGIHDGLHRLAAAIVRGDESIAIRTRDGVFGHGDVVQPRTGPRIEFDNGSWQIVADDGIVLRRLPRGSTIRDADATLEQLKSAPDRAAPVEGSAQAGNASDEWIDIWHGTPNRIEGPLRPSKTGWLGGGFYGALSPDRAGGFATSFGRVHRLQARGPFISDSDFIALRDRFVAEGLEKDAALAAAIRDAQSQGFNGVRGFDHNEVVSWPDASGAVPNVRWPDASSPTRSGPAVGRRRLGDSDNTTGAAAIATGALGTGLLLGDEAQAQEGSQLNEARSRVSELESAAEIFSSVDAADPSTVRRAQQALQARGLFVEADGRMGPDTARAIGEYRNQVNAELEEARARLEALELEERSQSTRAGPAHEAARFLGPYAGLGAGMAAGYLSRSGAVRRGASELAESNARADALITPGPVRLGRSAAERAEPGRRVGNVNEFWRLGGAGERVPYVTAQTERGFRPRPGAAPASELFPPDMSALRLADIGVVGAGAADAGLSTYFLEGAEQELEAAQAAVDLDPSEPNLVRLERARDAVKLWETAQRAGLGLAAGRLGGAFKTPYSRARPNVGAAEAERIELNRFLAAQRGRGGRRTPQRRLGQRREIDDE